MEGKGGGSLNKELDFLMMAWWKAGGGSLNKELDF